MINVDAVEDEDDYCCHTCTVETRMWPIMDNVHENAVVVAGDDGGDGDDNDHIGDDQHVVVHYVLSDYDNEHHVVVVVAVMMMLEILCHPMKHRLLSE